MSFKMTHSIIVEGYKPFKCNDCSWKRSMDNWADYGKFIIPGICKLQQPDKQYKVVPSGMAFKEGSKISISCGYDGNNKIRFVGFINRINFKIPVEVECEGYSYQLKHRTPFTHTYSNAKLKSILSDLILGTDIVLSENIPDVTVTYARFSNCTGIQVLEWFKDKMLMTIYFQFNELYVGLRYTNTLGKTIKHRLNWNVIKDDDLLFEQNKEATKINVHLSAPLKSGGHQTLKSDSKTGNVKRIKVLGLDVNSDFGRKLKDDLEKKENHAGYTGKITTFLEPIVTVNDVSSITDAKYNERTGRYVIEGLEGRFNKNGGRQVCQIGINVG